MRTIIPNFSCWSPADTNSPEKTEEELETQPQRWKSELLVCAEEEVAAGNPGSLRKGQCFRQT